LDGNPTITKEESITDNRTESEVQAEVVQDYLSELRHSVLKTLRQ
jgi:uncharacterized protein YnzC (UPF0291/DUF896 family)